MTEKEIRDGLWAVLRDEAICFEENGENMDLRQYIFDSIQFVNLIVAIENQFGIRLKDDYITYDILQSPETLMNAIKNSL